MGLRGRFESDDDYYAKYKDFYYDPADREHPPRGTPLGLTVPDDWAQKLHKHYYGSKHHNLPCLWSQIQKLLSGNVHVGLARLNLRGTRFCYPLCEREVEANPVRVLWNNEDPATGTGGPYAVSTCLTLHGGKPQWLYRPPPLDYGQVLEALQAGKVKETPHVSYEALRASAWRSIIAAAPLFARRRWEQAEAAA